jgi:hypothetical protein
MKIDQLSMYCFLHTKWNIEYDEKVVHTCEERQKTLCDSTLRVK